MVSQYKCLSFVKTVVGNKTYNSNITLYTHVYKIFIISLSSSINIDSPSNIVEKVTGFSLYPYYFMWCAHVLESGLVYIEVSKMHLF